MIYDVEKVKTYLKSHLNEHRFLHSVSVAETAYELAIRFREDPDDAYLAGLLHDIAKEYDDDTILKLAKENNIRLTDEDINNPGVIHSYLGAIMAKKIFNVPDYICDAIKTHTLGDYMMTKLQKIIFISDFIEPKRKFIKDIPEVIEASKYSLEKCLELTYKRTIEYIKSKNQNIHPKTIEIYNKLKTE